ncbi:MAG: hypothetical protein ACXADB_04750 [Candidatus Hermodarchaeia archaeon]|jgi:hypothetical protein
MFKNRKKVVLISFLVIVGLLFPVYLVTAQSATSQTWTSTIAYMNAENTSGSLTVTFFDGAGIAYPSDSIALNSYQSGTLLVGSVSSLSDGFAGSAVLSSTVKLAATYIESVSGAEAPNYDRKMYNGFTPGMASNTYYLPTVLKAKFGSTSQVGIQNVDSSSDAEATLNFYPVGETTPALTLNQTIQPQSSYVFSMADVALPDGFTGSLKITTTGGQVVASAQETWDSDRYSYAFEGVDQGSSKVFVPTMLCRFGVEQQISYYAVQAVGGTANVTMKHYRRSDGAQVGSTYNFSIGDGGKQSVNPCSHGTVPDTSIGSSVIESTGAPVIVIVKIVGTNGMRTAYIAEGTYAVVGSAENLLPYVRWDDDYSAAYRSYIAIQNIGDTNATDVQALYYNQSGSLVATHVLATGGSPLLPLQKINTQAASAGATSGGVFSGGVRIVSDQPVLVVVRNAIVVDLGLTTQFAEDYTGIRLP